MKKVTKARELQIVYAGAEKPLDRSAQLVMDKLSKARAVDYNQIISEIDKWALEKYYEEL